MNYELVEKYVKYKEVYERIKREFIKDQRRYRHVTGYNGTLDSVSWIIINAEYCKKVGNGTNPYTVNDIHKHIKKVF